MEKLRKRLFCPQVLDSPQLNQRESMEVFRKHEMRERDNIPTDPGNAAQTAAVGPWEDELPPLHFGGEDEPMSDAQLASVMALRGKRGEDESPTRRSIVRSVFVRKAAAQELGMKGWSSDLVQEQLSESARQRPANRRNGATCLGVARPESGASGSPHLTFCDGLGVQFGQENLLPMGMRQVDAGANLNQLYHSQVPTVVLRSHGDSDFFDGTGRPDLPAHGTGVRLPDVGLHDMQNYFQRLLSLHLRGRDAHAHLPNWRLVAQEQLDTIEAVDNLWIVQNQNSQDCLLTFEGTHTFTQFFRTLGGHVCVHSGYAEKLRWLMKGVMSKLRPKLSKCYRVGCTGHSLGGALCEIFAACVNSGRVGHPDFEAATWSAGEKELMPQIAQKPLSRDNLGAH
eukprot:g30323.t1